MHRRRKNKENKINENVTRMVISFWQHLNTDCSWAVSFQLKTLHCLTTTYCRNNLAISNLFLDYSMLIWCIGVLVFRLQSSGFNMVCFFSFIKMLWHGERVGVGVWLQSRHSLLIKSLCILRASTRNVWRSWDSCQRILIYYGWNSVPNRNWQNCCAPY